MIKSQLDKLKERVLLKKGKGTGLTSILVLAREFGCLPEIIGRNYEVCDRSGRLVYTIKQKPIAVKQLNTLLKELETLKKLDAKAEAEKWGKGKKGKSRRKR